MYFLATSKTTRLMIFLTVLFEAELNYTQKHPHFLGISLNQTPTSTRMNNLRLV